MSAPRDIIERPPGASDDDAMEVVIVRRSDDAQRVYRPDWKPHFTWEDEFWWTEGNAGCDCNRRLLWARAVEPHEAEPEDERCGNTEFTVILRAPGSAT